MIFLGLDEARRSEAAAAAARRSLQYETFASMGLVGPPVVSGVTVSQKTANSVTAYWNGVCVIAGDVGVMDRHLYQKIGDGDDRERVDNDPVAKLLAQPNPDTSAVTFWETLTSHAVSWGNGYAEIEFDNALRPIGLWNLTPDRVEVKVETFKDRRGRITSRRYYVVDGRTRLESEDVLHVAGLGFDGICGYSPVALFRQSLGLTIAAERFGAALFGNGAMPGVVLQHPNKIANETIERLRSDIAAYHTGPDRAHRTLILDQGMTASKPITIPPDDAQFLETRGLQIEETARILNMPPHKLKHKVNERPGGNFEASELDYTVTTLLPWTERIEQECDRKLLSPARRGTYYTEHNYPKRLKTDTSTRMNAYKSLYDMKVITPQLIAQKENLPAPPDPEPTPAPPAPPDPPPVDDAARGVRLAQAQRGALAAVLQRFLRLESEKALRASRKGPKGFGEWVDGYYTDAQRTLLWESLEPALALCLAATGSQGDARGVAQAFAGRYLEQSKGELLALKASELESAVPALLRRWEATRTSAGVDELMAALTAAEVKHVA